MPRPRHGLAAWRGQVTGPSANSPGRGWAPENRLERSASATGTFVRDRGLAPGTGLGTDPARASAEVQNVSPQCRSAAMPTSAWPRLLVGAESSGPDNMAALEIADHRTEETEGAGLHTPPRLGFSDVYALLKLLSYVSQSETSTSVHPRIARTLYVGVERDSVRPSSGRKLSPLRRRYTSYPTVSTTRRGAKSCRTLVVGKTLSKAARTLCSLCPSANALLSDRIS